MAKGDMIFRLAPELKEIAVELKDVTALMWRLYHIDLDRVGFLYETTCERSKYLAELRKVDGVWHDALSEHGANWDWLIVVYGHHAEGKSRKWLKLVIYHELRHIGYDGKLVEHNVEDFKDILREFGIDWQEDEELPDIAEMKPAHLG